MVCRLSYLVYQDLDFMGLLGLWTKLLCDTRIWTLWMVWFVDLVILRYWDLGLYLGYHDLDFMGLFGLSM